MGEGPGFTTIPYNLTNSSFSPFFFYIIAFPVDFTKNYERRQYLASYLLPEDPNNGNLIFIIVSEPSTSTTQSAECEEIGYAMINIRQIIQDNCDIDHVFIPSKKTFQYYASFLYDEQVLFSNDE